MRNAFLAAFKRSDNSSLRPPRASASAFQQSPAQPALPAAGGKERNIDLLHVLYTVSGLRKPSDFTRQVVRDSIEVEWRKGTFIRVMDPFDVLESRAQNAVGLYEDKGPHVVTQAKWAIHVARAALSRLASDPASHDRLGAKLQRIHTLARSQVGRRLWSEHRIELLAAIDIDALEAAAPRLSRQLDAIRPTISDRRVCAFVVATRPDDDRLPAPQLRTK